MKSKLLASILLVVLVIPMEIISQTAITDIDAVYRSAPDDINRYSDGGDNYSYGVGATGNDNLLFEDFFIDNGTEVTYFAIQRLADDVRLRRVDNASTTGNRHIVFFEQESNPSNGAGIDYNIRPEYTPTMEETLLSRFINRGSDNVFANASGTNLNNIERIDFIFTDGITVPADPTEQGFLILERGGNDDFTIAGISSLDASDDPDAYNSVVFVDQSNWTDTSTSIITDVMSGFTEAPDNENLLHTADVSSQPIAGIYFTFADLGFSAGETIYGYSLAGGDVTTNATDFVDFTVSANFPNNTDATSNTNGGLDLLAGGAAVQRAFIHNSDGWVDDPSGISDCNEIIVITAGTAPITAETTIGDITVDNGASLDSNGNTINICDGVFISRDFNPIDSHFNFIDGGLSVQNFITTSDALEARRLTIDSVSVNNSNGLRLDNTELAIRDDLTVTDGTLTTNDHLVFLSNEQETGQLAALGPTGAINGGATVERWIDNQRAFRFLSSPLNTGTPIRNNWQEGVNNTSFADYPNDNQNPNPGFGTHITGSTTGANGFDAQPSGNPSMFEWDNADQSWSPISDTNATNLDPASPYRIMVRGDRSVNITDNGTTPTETILRSSGTLQTGTQTLTGSTLSSGTFNSTENAYNLIGNPYQAAVDMQQVLSRSTNVNPTYLYVWDTSLATRGGFACIDVTNSANNCPATTSANQFLQPGQAAFFITGSAGTAPSLEFRESDINTLESVETTIFSDLNNTELYLELFHKNRYTNGEKAQDAVRFEYSPNFVNSLTPKDAEQIGNLDENFAVFSNQKVLTIEKRALPTLADNHQLYTWPLQDMIYMMTIEVNNLDSSLTAILVDNYLDTKINLNSGFNEYSFSVDTNIPLSAAWNRFNIIFVTNTLGIDDNQLENNLKVYPNPTSDILNIDLNKNISGIDKLQLYDVNGKLVYKQNLKNLTNTKIDVSQLSSGVYLLKIKTNDKTFNKKIIVD